MMLSDHDDLSFHRDRAVGHYSPLGFGRHQLSSLGANKCRHIRSTLSNLERECTIRDSSK